MLRVPHAILPSFAAALVVSAALAGCGGGGTKGAAPATTTTSAAATTTAGATTTAAATTTSGTASTAASKAPASTDPCSLLTDAEVAKLAPGVGHGKLDTVPGGAKICDWPDAHGVPAVQLQVYAASGSSLRTELKDTIAAFGGYTIVDVPGLGDEAAAAFQKADPSKGIAPGLAALVVRTGDRVIGLTTPYVSVQQGSPGFALAKTLAAKALARLKAGG